MSSGPCAIPIVVQVGFAGSRRLFDRDAHPALDEATFLVKVEQLLVARLRDLPAELGLNQRHFLCGLSQVAVGGDLAFSRACGALGIPHRVFLPLPADEYLAARGREGVADFDPDDQVDAASALAAEHVIQVRVVSDAADRLDRFRDVNSELARVSDVMVCLVARGQTGSAGGTLDAIDRARARNRPTLVLTLDVRDDEPDLRGEWEWNQPLATNGTGDSLRWRPPALPWPIESVAKRIRPVCAPSAETALTQLAKDTRVLTSRHSRLFRLAAVAIVAGHVAATVCAAFALGFQASSLVGWLLAAEVLLLAGSVAVHTWLHRTHAARAWAAGRLAAEAGRSVGQMAFVGVQLEHVFALPFPDEFRPLLRTLNVLHLWRTRNRPPAERAPWPEVRRRYIEERIAGPGGTAWCRTIRVRRWWPTATGNYEHQLAYYLEQTQAAVLQLRYLRGVFFVCSCVAVVVVAAKLSLPHGESGIWPAAVLGMAAIALPVVAVGALSWAAALDLEARARTFRTMADFLERQVMLIDAAASEREFERLVLEIESRLLGETVNWYARRAYVGVA